MNVQSDFTAIPEQIAAIVPDLLLLPGEQGAIYCFRALDAALVARGQADGADWIALTWSHEGQLNALAVLGSTTFGDIAVTGSGDTGGLRLGQPGRITADSQVLAQFLTVTGAPLGDVLQLLDTGLGTGPGAGAANRFMANLLRETSEIGGFIEVSARPECGGLFLQGWAHAPLRGQIALLGEAVGIEATAAGFERKDILAPASGLCLFIKDWDGRLEGNSVLFVAVDGRPLRLDVLPGAAQPVEGSAGTEHIRSMLPQLDAEGATLAGFQRICRPRYRGVNTLADHPGATTAAIDRILHTQSGGLFVTGWLLDPLAQVDRAILKSTANLYSTLR